MAGTRNAHSIIEVNILGELRPSLRVYVLVEQEMPAVLVYRRTEQGFVREVYEGLEAVLPLQDIGTSLPLAEMYERVDFVPEADEEA